MSSFIRIATPQIYSLVINDFTTRVWQVIDICESEDKTLIDLLEERILKIYPNT